MFKKQIEKMVSDCHKTVLKSQNPQIKKAISRISKDLPNDFDEFIDATICRIISQTMMMRMPDEILEPLFADYIEDIAENAIDFRKAAKFKVVLDGHEKQIYRQIQIPFTENLSDLAYLILASFEAEGSHLFCMKHKHTTYYCDNDYDEENHASMVALCELDLKPGQKLSMTYDYGDNYEFTIKFVGYTLCDTILEAEDPKVLEGKGYGIWEDSHHELDLYYEDPKKFSEYIEKEGFSEEFYPIHEVFDLEGTNLMLEEGIACIRECYENDDTYDEDDEDDDDDELFDEELFMSESPVGHLS